MKSNPVPILQTSSVQDHHTPLSTPLRLALREIRNRPKGFGVFLLCLMLGVGAVSGIGTLSAALDAGIRNNTRIILGGDLEIRQTHMPIPDAVQEALEQYGAVSRVVRMRAMVRGPAGATTLTELKAVDDNYPLYGSVGLRSKADLAERLTNGQTSASRNQPPSAVAEESLLLRIGASVGDLVMVGETAFRITDVLEREPDKAAGFFGLGPRLLVSLDDLEATGLLQPGSVVRYGLRTALLPGVAAESVREDLNRQFPQATWQVREHGAAARGLTRAIDNFAKYLGLVGLAALLIGGLGVAGSVHAYFESRRNTLATMRCLGATSRTLFVFCLGQVLFMAVIGSISGLALGLSAANLGAIFLTRSLGLQAVPGVYPDVLATALILGLCTTLAFVLRPLFLALRFSPSELFRGYVQPDPQPLRWRERGMILVAWCALGGLIVASVDDIQTAVGFLIAALVSVIVFAAVARIVKLVAARASRSRIVRLWVGPRLRHALANLHRPGAMTAGVIFSLGLGLTMLTTVALVDASVLDRIKRQMPQQAPDFFFVDIPRAEIVAFREAVQSWPEVTQWRDQPSVRSRILEIGGLSPEEALQDPSVEWVIRGERGVTFANRPMEDVRIVGGSWWPEDYAGPPQVCMDANIARGLGAGLGDTLVMGVLGREVRATITCLREVDWESLALNHSIIFSPGVLEAAPYTHIATISLEPGTSAARREALVSALTRDFSRTAAVDVRDVLKDVARVTDQVGIGVRAAAGMTLLAGVVVLAGVVRTGLHRRGYEAAVFKVCGATRGDVRVMLGLEFLFLGAVSALLAGILGTGLAWWFVTQILEDPWVFMPRTLLMVLLLALLAVLVFGLAGMRSVLAARPWSMLRNE